MIVYSFSSCQPVDIQLMFEENIPLCRSVNPSYALDKITSSLAGIQKHYLHPQNTWVDLYVFLSWVIGINRMIVRHCIQLVEQNVIGICVTLCTHVFPMVCVLWLFLLIWACPGIHCIIIGSPTLLAWLPPVADL